MLQKKIRLFAFFSIIASTILPVPAALGVTLRYIVSHAVHTNPRVQITMKVRRADVEEVDRARAGYLPRINMRLAYGHERSRNSTTRILGIGSVNLIRKESDIHLTQNLFDGFSTLYDVARVKAKTVADAYRVWGTAEEVGLDTVLAYIDVMRDRRLVAVARDNLRIHQKTYGMIKKRSEQGVGRKADINQARGRLELARANLIAAQNNLLDSNARYFRVVGLKPEKDMLEPVSPSQAVLPRTLSDAITQAINQHPLMKSAIADVKEANAQHYASRAVNLPRIDAVIDAGSNRNIEGAVGPNEDVYGYFELQYNLFNGGADIARQHETAYLSQEASEIRNRTYREVVENISLVWDTLVSQRRRLPAILAHVRAAQATVKAYRQQFQLGKRTLLDMLDSENELFRAREAYIQTRYVLLLAKYRMLQAKGALLSYLNVPLPAESHLPYYARYIREKQMVMPVMEFKQRFEKNTGEPRALAVDYRESVNTRIVDQAVHNWHIIPERFILPFPYPPGFLRGESSFID